MVLSAQRWISTLSAPQNNGTIAPGAKSTATLRGGRGGGCDFAVRARSGTRFAAAENPAGALAGEGPGNQGRIRSSERGKGATGAEAAARTVGAAPTAGRPVEPAGGALGTNGAPAEHPVGKAGAAGEPAGDSAAGDLAEVPPGAAGAAGEPAE